MSSRSCEGDEGDAARQRGGERWEEDAGRDEPDSLVTVSGGRVEEVGKTTVVAAVVSFRRESKTRSTLARRSLMAGRRLRKASAPVSSPDAASLSESLESASVSACTGNEVFEREFAGRTGSSSSLVGSVDWTSRRVGEDVACPCPARIVVSPSSTESDEGC